VEREREEEEKVMIVYKTGPPHSDQAQTQLSVSLLTTASFGELQFERLLHNERQIDQESVADVG
jgi:hypothetical protein